MVARGSGPSVAAAEQPKTPPAPLAAESSGELPPPGEITEAQAQAFPQVQSITCPKCGRMVPTPQGKAGYVVKCAGPNCGNLVEALPF